MESDQDRLFVNDWLTTRYLYVVKTTLKEGHENYPKAEIVQFYKDRGLEISKQIIVYYIGQSIDVYKRLRQHNNIYGGNTFTNKLAPNWELVYKKCLGVLHYSDACNQERKCGNVYVKKSVSEMLRKYRSGEQVLLDRIIIGPRSISANNEVGHYWFAYPDNPRARFPNAELFLSEKLKLERSELIREIKIIDKTGE